MSEEAYIWHRVQELGPEGVESLADRGRQMIEVEGRRLCVIRVGEKVSVFRPKCPHGGAPLENAGVNEAGDLVCPWHRFTYCPSTGANTSGEGYSLEVYPVKVEKNVVYVGTPAPRPKKWWFW